jgi:hypothetical protein
MTKDTCFSATLIALQRCPLSLAASATGAPGVLFSIENLRYPESGLLGALGSLIILVLVFCLYFFARRRRLVFSSLISVGDSLEMALAYACLRVALIVAARVL